MAGSAFLVSARSKFVCQFLTLFLCMCQYFYNYSRISHRAMSQCRYNNSHTYGWRLLIYSWQSSSVKYTPLCYKINHLLLAIYLISCENIVKYDGPHVNNIWQIALYLSTSKSPANSVFNNHWQQCEQMLAYFYRSINEKILCNTL